MEGVIRDVAAEFGRIIWGTGSGVLAICNGDPGTTTTVTVDSPGGIAGATNGSRFLRPGQLITFVVPAAGTLVGSADETITARAAAGTTVTIGSAAATGIADNDVIVRANKAGLTDISDTGYNQEPEGLLAANDDGTYVATYHGINRTAYPLLASTVITVNGALSADVLQRLLDVTNERGDADTTLITSHSSVRRAYLTMMENDRRYQAQDLMNPDAGTRAAKNRNLSFGGIEWETDKYHPYGMVMTHDTSGYRRYVEVAGEWADEDGSVLRPTGAGSSFSDQWEAFYRIWQNFHNERPAACGRLDGVTASVVVVGID
jgi:hypothetical protein